MEEDRINPMSGSEVRFQTQIPPTRSTLGLALRLQVVSAILIIGGLLSLREFIPLSSIVLLTLVGVLYAIGFLQLIILRTMLQKAKYSARAAGVAAYLAILIAVNLGRFIRPVGLWWRMLPLIASAAINFILLLLLLEIHLEGGIESVFSSMDASSSSLPTDGRVATQ